MYIHVIKFVLYLLQSSSPTIKQAGVHQIYFLNEEDYSEGQENICIKFTNRKKNGEVPQFHDMLILQ